MFEIIGLLLATGVLFAGAAVVGAVFAAFARLLAPGELPSPTAGLFSSSLPRRRSPGVAFAFFIPILSALYLWLCVAFLPGQSFFGDIDQPLPNGAVLTALGKMPEYGQIDPIQNSVDQLAVSGPLVATRTCITCSEASIGAAEPYQLLDTRNHQVTQFPDQPSLERAFGKALTLVATQDFHSDEPAYQRRQRLDHAIMFIPPILLTLVYFALLIRRRLAPKAFAAHLY